MRRGRRRVSGTFVLVALGVAIGVGMLVAGLVDGTDVEPRDLSASRELTEAYMALVCRPPTAADVLVWDTKGFTIPELAAEIRATPEGVRVRELRRVYIEILARDPFDGDCAGLRRWVERPLAVGEVARRLAGSPEARRVAETRRLLTRTEGRNPAGWDNASVRRWLQGGFTPAEVETALAARRPLVGVYYFAWYEQSSDGWGNRVSVVPADTPQPVLGWYSSNDAAVMDEHIEQMERAAFDFVIIQVIADSAASWTTAHRFFGRLAGRGLRAVVMVDGLYTSPLSVVSAWVEKANAEFGSHPNYLSVRGAPLILLFSGRADFSPPGVMMRNVYWADSYAPGANTFNPDGLLLPHDWPFWAPAPPPLVNGMVPVLPGYSDTHLQRKRSMEHPRNDGQTYHEQWQRALALRPEFIVVYSWNEHFERTAIEPTESWGDRYLRWTACYIGHARAGRVGGC